MKAGIFHKITIILGTALFLNACTTGVAVKDSDSILLEQREADLRGIKELKENGKIALFSKTESRRLSISSIYHYKENVFSLEFTGLMGATEAKLEVYKNGSVYLDIQGHQFSGDRARALLKEQFNLDLPVEELHSIMLGLPDGKCEYNENGLVKRALIADGISIDYKEYKTFEDKYTLPTLAQIETPMAKVVIKISSVQKIK